MKISGRLSTKQPWLRDEGSFNYWGRKNDVKINQILSTIRKEKKSQGKDFPFPFEKDS